MGKGKPFREEILSRRRDQVLQAPQRTGAQIMTSYKPISKSFHVAVPPHHQIYSPDLVMQGFPGGDVPAALPFIQGDGQHIVLEPVDGGPVIRVIGKWWGADRKQHSGLIGMLPPKVCAVIEGMEIAHLVAPHLKRVELSSNGLMQITFNITGPKSRQKVEDFNRYLEMDFGEDEGGEEDEVVATREPPRSMPHRVVPRAKNTAPDSLKETMWISGAITGVLVLAMIARLRGC